MNYFEILIYHTYVVWRQQNGGGKFCCYSNDLERIENLLFRPLLQNLQEKSTEKKFLGFQEIILRIYNRAFRLLNNFKVLWIVGKNCEIDNILSWIFCWTYVTVHYIGLWRAQWWNIFHRSLKYLINDKSKKLSF